MPFSERKKTVGKVVPEPWLKQTTKKIGPGETLVLFAWSGGIMKEKFRLVRIDENYCDYLREYDSRVMFNSEDKRLRPFVGVMLSVNGLDYYAPMTSPKPDFEYRKNSPIFQKIAGGELGAIRLGYMIPVPRMFVKPIDLKHYCLTDAELNYQNLLKKQLRLINKDAAAIERKARRLYATYADRTLPEWCARFCCNFPLLEEKCLEFMRLNGLAGESLESRLESAKHEAELREGKGLCGKGQEERELC